MAETADLTQSDLLDEVDAVRRRQLEAGVELLQLVAEFARQHDAGTVDPIQAQLPGRERIVRLGGEGTPMVAEFAPSMLAARLGLSPYAGGRLVADVLDLNYRLPQHWAGVQAHQISEQHARYVARKTRNLSREEAAYVDARVAPSADGRLSWTRFETLVEAAIKAADPDSAEARERTAARETFARTTHSTEHGMRGFYLRADFATVARIDATVAYLAQALLTMGDTSSLDHRRVKAVLIMANPTQAVKILAAYAEYQRRQPATDPEDVPEQEAVSTEPERFDPTEAADLLEDAKLLPAVWLYVHLAGGHTTGTGPIARVEGSDPVTTDWVRRHLGDRCNFKITPVFDPLDQIPVDAYEIPDPHRQAVHLMTPADTFPFAANTTRKVQIDHNKEWSAQLAAAGKKLSRIGNYGPMVTFHHRIKTHGGWAVRQPFPGVYLWRDPCGAMYLVDHTGTRRVGPQGQPDKPPLGALLAALTLAS